MSKCKVSLVRNKDVKVAVFWVVRPGSQKIDGGVLEEPTVSIFRARCLFVTLVLLCDTVGPQEMVI
jgi:hypothetical protein